MAFCTIGVSKQKGGSVGASGRHNDRGREVPNADPERTHLNRVLVGDERPVRERVSEIISKHGGKPRRDSVEAVELLLSASHEYFAGPDGGIDPERLERWVGQARKFLGDRRNLGICAKAVLHLDERTPHIHAHMVPITEEGRLSATHFLDGREKMKALHTRHAEHMKELGLERGREGSRATHQRVKQFYASVSREPELKIEPDRIPDPGRLKLLTAEGARGYKLEVLRHVLEQIKEPIRILQDQARLTRDERAHRVEAERRAQESERQAAERVEAAEREAEERVASVRREEAERFELLRKSALQLLEENREQQREKEALCRERNELRESLAEMTREKREYQLRARDYQERLSDIPLHEVMERLGYEGERHGQFHVYRGERGEAAMLVERQKAFDHRRELICKNSLDLVVHMRRHNEGVEGFTHTHALEWLREEFGDRRAAGAAVAQREQAVLEVFDRGREGRERERALVHERSDDPGRVTQGRGARPRLSRPGHGARAGRRRLQLRPLEPRGNNFARAKIAPARGRRLIVAPAGY